MHKNKEFPIKLHHSSFFYWSSLVCLTSRWNRFKIFELIIVCLIFLIHIFRPLSHRIQSLRVGCFFPLLHLNTILISVHWIFLVCDWLFSYFILFLLEIPIEISSVKPWYFPRWSIFIIFHFRNNGLRKSLRLCTL